MIHCMHTDGPRRWLAGLLCLVMLAGMLPAGLLLPASAEEAGVEPAATAEADGWVRPYLDKLLEWDVMRGDQEGNLDPDRPITRAEYISMINRAYGYDEVGQTIFEDVPITAWYADDIAIAYRAGYFAGTSEKTAAPEELLTREQATVILGRNLMLQSGSGESLDFTDSRNLSDWSRGMVKTAAEYGMVKGYPDGSFRPQSDITRGEVASLLVSAIGTPVNKSGDYTLGNVQGNVTVSSSGVILRNTVIAGDLYISGGVGLGHVTLENVTVLGKIIASGAGESHSGESSIILRNVTAPQMVVDGPGNQFVTLRVEGDTKIENTSVRTPSYLEDTTGENLGLKFIELNGEAGTTLQLAGNIKEVASYTPSGQLVMARGSANVVTVDEKAVGSTVTVDQGGEIKDLRLDVATKVGGKGDIQSLTVSANGSVVTILPDKITVRPGTTANITGENMNTVTATESSEAPRLQAGYPKVVDTAPTTATLVFSGNKKGVIYWAVSSVTDGSVGEDDLISPPSYGGLIVKSGSLKADASSHEYTAKVTGLTSDGSYYVSAILVDSRGQRSPVKVTSFGTPDDSVPNFGTGYPYMSKVGNTDAQVTVMTTKSCRLYYALLPKGAAAPTAADFKAGALSGNLGAGTWDVVRSNTYPITVNNKPLTELASYDLYLWLTDVDGAKSSAVKKLSFTTMDKTPPTYDLPVVTNIQATALGLTTSMNETGTLYWVVVKAGSEYPKPIAGSGVAQVPLDSETAKIQVASGLNALKSGKQAMTENKEGTFNISGLATQTAYDLYTVVQDKAGNFSATVKKQTVNTLDNMAPTAGLEFTKYNGTDKNNPTADTDVRIMFNERVQTFPDGVILDELYKEVIAPGKTADEIQDAKNKMAKVLGSIFTFYDLTGGDEQVAPVRVNGNESDWTVDYHNAKIVLDDAKTIITLPTTAASDSALNLKSGSTYRIDVRGISDASRNNAGTLYLPDKKGFTTVFAQVNLKQSNVQNTESDGSGETIHISFELTPVATSKVDNSISWDMLLWSDVSVAFHLYRREVVDKVAGEWKLINPDRPAEIVVASGGESPIGVSLTAGLLEQRHFDQLNTLQTGLVYEYGVSFTKMDGNLNENTWSRTVNFKVGVAAGSNNELGNLAANVTPSAWKSQVVDGRSLTSIGNSVAQGSDELSLRKTFSDKVEPKFVNEYPNFVTGDSSVQMTVMLDRPGTVYYVVAPAVKGPDYPDDKDESRSTVNTKQDNGVGGLADVLWGELPKSGSKPIPTVVTPGYLDIVGNKLTAGNPDIKWGSAVGGASATTITVKGLKAETPYFVYFVLKGSASVYSEVRTYGFETEKVVRPILELFLNNPKVEIRADRDATADYLLIAEKGIPNFLNSSLYANCNDPENLPPQYQGKENTGTADNPSYVYTYTLWNAIQDDVTINGNSTGSVFDLYATAAIKETVANYIRNQKPDGDVVLKGQQTLSPGDLQTVDCTSAMKAGTQYFFLAVGKSPLGSGDAFRAIRPVELRDVSAPTVVDIQSWAIAGTTAGTYTGSLTLTFSEAIYAIEKGAGGSAQTITPVEALPANSPNVSKGFVPLGNYLTPPPTVTIAPATVAGKAMETVVFDYQNMRPGQVIIFASNLGDASGNSQKVALSVAMLADPEGGMPTFSITPKVWDGR